MAARVYQEEFRLNLPPLEVAGEPARSDPGYPLPTLRVAGPPQEQVFSALVLENDWLRITVLPELGGRIASILDRRTGVECLPATWDLAEGGPRGVWIRGGIQWEFGEPNRRTSMAAVDAQIVETEDGAARINLAERIPGLDLSWHLWLELPSDRACLSVEWRALNRRMDRDLPYRSGLLVGGAEPHPPDRGAILFRDRTSEAGFAFHFDPDEFDSWSEADGDTRIVREFPFGALAPRQTDHAQLLLMAFPGPDFMVGAWPEAAVGFGEGEVVVLPFQDFEARVAIQDSLGGHHEAPISAKAGEEQRFKFPEGIRAAVIGLVFADGRPTRAFPSEKWASSQPAEATSFDGKVGPRDPRCRPAEFIRKAHQELKADRPAEAASHLEDALLFNGDDPLAWWLKAAAARHLEGDEETGDLPNAHFLAPMEPLLRAEAFLSQPVSPHPEPNPILNPLAENPDDLVEVGVRLLEAGLALDAARFLDEAIRLRDLPMLRYLAAANFLARRGMEAEAAMHLAAAGKMPFGPPFPWREFEFEALRALAERFPADLALKRYRDLEG